MRNILFAAALAISSSASAQSSVALHDLMTPYFKIFDQRESHKRLAAMKAFIAEHPELYGPIIPVMSDEGLAKYIADEDRRLPLERELALSIAAQFPKTLLDMERRLGPLKEAKAYIAPSLFTSNGQVRMQNGVPMIAFGPDVQAIVVTEIVPRQPPYDVRALVAHELFHAQHDATNTEMAQNANALFSSAERPPLYINLWIEGLATCASMMFDGDGAIEDALMDNVLPSKLPTQMLKVAEELKAKMMSTDDNDYRDFFWLSGERTDIPKRTAYGVGAIVADRIIRKIGLRAAMQLGGNNLKIAVADALDKMVTDGSPVQWSAVCE